MRPPCSFWLWHRWSSWKDVEVKVAYIYKYVFTGEVDKMGGQERRCVKCNIVQLRRNGE